MTESDFQKLCCDFVREQVWGNVTEMADYIIKKSYDDPDAPFSIDDIEWYRGGKDEDDDDGEYEGDEDDDEDYDEDDDCMPEWFEVFVVSPYLVEKLYNYGEPVYRNQYGADLWFRTTFGQATYIDWVIRKIVKEDAIHCGHDPREFDSIHI
jgi:hypothetical protein